MGEFAYFQGERNIDHGWSGRGVITFFCGDHTGLVSPFCPFFYELSVIVACKSVAVG